MFWLGILCEMPLCFLLRWSSRLRKVFHKKRVEHWWSLPLPSPGAENDGQQPPATGSAALYWCHERTEAALHTLIKLYQQLASCPPQPCSLSSSLSVSLHLNLSPSLCIFHSNTHNAPPHGPFAASCCMMALQREPPPPCSLTADKYLLFCPDLFWVN